MTAFATPPNPFLRRMEQGQRALGTFVFSPDPGHVEVVASAGFDLAVVDLEHAPLHIGDVANHVRAAQAAGLSCWVRVGHTQPSEIGRLLDAGVQGVILPHFGMDSQATEGGARRDAVCAGGQPWHLHRSARGLARLGGLRGVRGNIEP